MFLKRLTAVTLALSMSKQILVTSMLLKLWHKQSQELFT